MTGLSAAAEDLLELLGLSAAGPSPRAFEDLFLRFQARVPYETLSRRRRGALGADELFGVLVGEGGGTAGTERARAFAALAAGLGYDVSLVPAAASGAAGREDDAPAAHAAVVARLDGKDVLADAGYPLPVLVPLDGSAGEIPTAFGRLSPEPREERTAVVCDGQGRRRDLILVGGAPAADPERAGDGDAEPLLLRVLDDRVLSWSAGRMRVFDSWSRLVYALAPTERDALRLLFAREDLESADLLGVADAPPAAARLTVFHACERPPGEILARLATPGGLLALQAPGTAVVDLREDGGGFTWRLSTDGGAVREERVEPRPGGLSVRALEGGGTVAERVYAVEPEGAGTRLVLAATLARSVAPLGLGESVRKTLVFHLASELLALAREAEA